MNNNILQKNSPLLRGLLLKIAPSLLVMSSIGFVSCESDDIDPVPNVPVAAFTNTQNFLEVTFEQASANAVSYSWDFGDESTTTDTSTLASPTYTYSEEGDYNVTLTITNSQGATDDTSAIITIDDGVDAGFSFAIEDLNTFDVQFTNESFEEDTEVRYTSFEWDFGDDTTLLQEITADSDIERVAALNALLSETVEHSYTDEGTYEVTLTATGYVGLTDQIVTEVATESVEVVLPYADFSVVTNGLIVTLENASSNLENVTIDFGDGSDAVSFTDSGNYIYQYEAAGTYTITVTGENGDSEYTTAQEVTVSE